MTAIKILQKKIKKEIKETNECFKRTDGMFLNRLITNGILMTYKTVLNSLIPESIKEGK